LNFRKTKLEHSPSFQALSAPHEVWLGATADSAAGSTPSLIQVCEGAQGRSGPGMVVALRLAGGPGFSILWSGRPSGDPRQTLGLDVAAESTV